MSESAVSQTPAANASLWDTFVHTPSQKQRVFMRYLPRRWWISWCWACSPNSGRYVVVELVHGAPACRCITSDPAEDHDRH